MSKPDPTLYRTTDWSYYNVALRKHGFLFICSGKDMALVAPIEGLTGLQQVYFEHRYPVLPVDQGATSANDRDGGRVARDCGFGMGSA